MKKLMLNLMLCLSLVLTGLVIPSVEVNAANEVPVATIDNVSIIADDNDTLGCIIGVDATQATTKDLTTEMVEAIDNYVQTNSLSEVEIFLVDVLSIPDNAFRNKSYLTGVNISADNGSTVTIGDNAFEGCTSLEWVMTFDAFSLTLGDECFKDIADYVTLSDFGKLSDLTLGTNVFLNIGSGVEISVMRFSSDTDGEQWDLGNDPMPLLQGYNFNADNAEMNYSNYLVTIEPTDGSSQDIDVVVGHYTKISTQTLEDNGIPKLYIDQGMSTEFDHTTEFITEDKVLYYNPAEVSNVKYTLTGTGTNNVTLTVENRNGGTLSLGDGSLAKVEELFTDASVADNTVTLVLKNVTHIGSDNFKNLTELKSIRFEDYNANSTLSIGNSAFEGCTNITELNLPDVSSISIGERAFYNCTSIAKLNNPYNITSIGTNAFYASTQSPLAIERYKTVSSTVQDLPQAVKNYDWTGSRRDVSYTKYKVILKCADENSNISKTVYVTSGQRINLADAGLSNELTIYTNNGMTSEYDKETAVTSELTLYYSAQELSNYLITYSESSGIPTVTVKAKDGGILDIEDDFIQNYNLLFTDNDVNPGEGKLILKNVRNIGDNAFSDLQSIKYLTIETGSQTQLSIGESAFENCSKLVELELPDCGGITLGDRAFAKCNSLTKLYGSVSDVTGVGSNVFRTEDSTDLMITRSLNLSATNESIVTDTVPEILYQYDWSGDNRDSAYTNNIVELRRPDGSSRYKVVKYNEKIAEEVYNQYSVNYNIYTDSGLTTPFMKGTLIAKDTILYLKEKVQYSVTFNGNGGVTGNANTKTVKFYENSKITQSSIPTFERQDYKFEGWYKDKEAKWAWSMQDDVVTSNITLYAKWSATKPFYTVSFVTQGGTTITNQSVMEGYKLESVKDPERTGYVFKGWFTDSNHTKAFDISKDTVSENITLYAKWEEKMVKITFNSMGGSSIDSLSVPQGGMVSKPTDPTLDGYTFDGWYKDSGRTNKFDFGSKLESDTTLYAKWITAGEENKTADNIINPDPNKITVVFNTQGGTQLDNAIYNKGSLLSVPPTPVRTGYTFLGWYKDSGYQTPWDFTKDTATENVTLYAKWIQGTVARPQTGDNTNGIVAAVINKLLKGGKF